MAPEEPVAEAQLSAGLAQVVTSPPWEVRALVQVEAVAP
jgi:hypothetical protein